ncbi:ATP-binding protein [Sorangium sp. So ce315]|uniref:ATP-binding protein n=1 Tax=Sorangium sp. So ce315 TaxID=3133299 RepID=UPI003F5FF8D8
MTTENDPAEALRALGFRASGEAIRALITHATRSKMSPAELCLELATLDKRERDQRNLAARTKDATLGPVKPLDRFDWSHPREIDRELFEEMHETLGFIARGENVLFRGQAGVGKSTLAKHLGFAALAKGHTVRFTTLAAALADLLRHETLPAIERRLRRYTGPDLLILDELGYVPCDASAADLLFRIVSKRHESRSVVITTNLSYKQWGTVFGDAPCLGALVDRFAQHCHVLDIDADSWRDKERLEKKGRAPRPRR